MLINDNPPVCKRTSTLLARVKGRHTAREANIKMTPPVKIPKSTLFVCLDYFLSQPAKRKKDNPSPSPPSLIDEDDVELNVLRCRGDILGTNCNKLLKLKAQT